MPRVRIWCLAAWEARFLDLEDPRIAITRQALTSRIVFLRGNWRGRLAATRPPKDPLDGKTLEWLVIAHHATLVGNDQSSVIASTGQYELDDAEYDTVESALRFVLGRIVRDDGYAALNEFGELLAGDLSVIGSDFDWIITQSVT